MQPRSKPGKDFHWGDNDLWRFHVRVIGLEAYGIYMLLASRADNKTGRCSLTHRQISAEAGISSDTITRLIGILEKRGLITVKRDPGYQLEFIVNRCTRQLAHVARPAAQPVQMEMDYPPQIPVAPPQKQVHPTAVCGGPNTNKEVLDSSQDSFQDSAHSVRGETDTTDPRAGTIKNLILDIHAVSVSDMPRDLVPWDKSEDRALAKLLADKPTLTVEIAWRCIQNFYGSVVDIQRRPAKGVIPQMLEFYGGEKTQYKHPKYFDQRRNADAFVGRA